MHQKQIERMVSKVENLAGLYQKYIIESKEDISNILLDGKRVKSGDLWGQNFGYGTFSFRVPKIDSNKKYYLTLITGATEHLVKVNGKEIGLIDYVKNPWEWVQRFHKYLLLDGIKENDLIEIKAYYSHHYPGVFSYHSDTIYGLNNSNDQRPFEFISLVTMDEDLKELVYSLSYLNEIYHGPTNIKEKQFYTEIYEDLFKVLSLKDEKPSKKSVKEGLKILSRIKNAKDEDLLPFVGIIGHSHLDTAWLWTIAETREKMHRTISNAVTLCKRHKEYKFFFSTVLYLEWLKEDDIDLYNDVIDLIKKGQIEANGASYIEFDSNLIGNESICRQFIRGKKFLKDEASFDSNTFWLPDTFGYSASLPQILKEVGVKYFLTTKLSWNDTNTFPYDTFNWTGIDGSSVLVHFTSIPGTLSPKIVEERLNSIIDKTTTTSALIAYGVGDGGGGPSEEVVHNALLTEENYKKAIVKHITVSDFMDRISKNKVPSYFGELYLELHRGTYTSIHDIKKYHKELEVTLHDFELVDVLSNENHQDIIDKNYDTLMINEFHDILPGTCIKEQNIISVNELKDAINNVNQQYIDKNGKFFNPLFKERIAYLDSLSGQEYIDLDGKKKHLNLYKFNPLSYGHAIKVKGHLDADLNHFKNDFLEGVIEDGVIKSLKYKGKEIVEGEFLKLKVAVNYPLYYDNWDIDFDYKFKEEDVEFISQELVSKGDKAVIYKLKHKFYNSLITTEVFIYSDSPVIEFKNKLEINDEHLLLRSYFDTSIFSNKYKSEIQFGNIERNTRIQGLEDEAKFETCSHNWLDLSDGTLGLSLLKKDLYGTSCDAKTIGLTLHKGGTHPDDRSDKGVHYFEYAIFPHDSILSMETIDKAYEFNYSPIRIDKNIDSSMFKQLEAGSCVIETVKHALNGGMVLRIYESLGKTSEFKLSLDKSYKLYDVDILENIKEELKSGDSLNLEFKPFEIKTILIKQK